MSARLLGAMGCQLCDVAKAAAGQVLGEYGLSLDYVLIDGDELLEAQYRSDIPVLELDGKRVAKYHIDELTLRQALERRGIQRQS